MQYKQYKQDCTIYNIAPYGGEKPRHTLVIPNPGAKVAGHKLN